MAECDLPSFSLGLDFTLDDDTPPPSPPSPSPNHVSDSDPDTHPDPPRRILKRLRRGPTSPTVLHHPPPEPEPPSCFDVDEDIEEFSSQDDPVPEFVHSLAQRNNSVCSSSKVSLNGSGVLNPHSTSNSRERKRKEPLASDVPASAGLETGQSKFVFSKLANGQSKFVFSKLATSPLRRFQLLDSDDDDDDLVEVVNDAHKVDPYLTGLTRNQSIPSTSFEQNKKTPFNVNQNPDLWKDFSPVKSFSIPTPAFNEVCEEYFSAAKNKKAEKSGIRVSENNNETYPGVNSGCQKEQQQWESAGPLPPAHHYFFHDDPKIQQLVRNRLCNFSPLGVNRVNQQPNVSHIDYMGQFDNGEASKTKGVSKGYVNGSTSRKNRSKNFVHEETFNASEGWVDPKIVSSFSGGKSSRKKATKRNSAKSSTSNASANWVEPKSCTSMPKDAGKRRVQASGQPAGHWFTGSDGRKVYVNKSGQELTGRMAYRQYQKDNGTGFSKSTNKTSAKKTNAKKTNSKKKN